MAAERNGQNNGRTDGPDGPDPRQRVPGRNGETAPPGQNGVGRPQEGQGAGRLDLHHWLILAALGLGLAIVIIDTTVVIVTIPVIRQRFSATLREVEWITDLYAIVFASLLLTAGKLADRYGRRRVLIGGVGIFVSGSIVVGLAPSINLILLGRFIQGVGGALIMPATLSILSSTFTGGSRDVAFGIWGGIAGGAVGIGPLLGGFLTTYMSWRYAFLINVPVGVIVTVLALRVIEESHAPERARGLDIPGVLLGGIGLGAIVFGAIEGQAYGFLHSRGVFRMGPFTWPFHRVPLSAAMFAIGLAAVIGFVVREQAVVKRGGDPLLDLRLLRFASFRHGLLTVGILMLGQSGMIFVLSLFLQTAKGFSAVKTGMVLFPFAAAVFVAAPLAGRLAGRVGPKWVVTSGMVCSAAAMFWLSRAISLQTTALWYAPVLLVYGVGTGLTSAQLTNVLMSEVPEQQTGIASGANSAMRQVGAAIGFALLGAMLAMGMASSGRAALARHHEIPAPIRSQLTGVLQQGLYLSGAGSTSGNLSPRQRQVIHGIMGQAMASGAREAAVVASVFILLGAFSSLLIPSRQDTRR